MDEDIGEDTDDLGDDDDDDDEEFQDDQYLITIRY